MGDASVRLTASAAGAAIAECLTLPLDVCKVRLQLQTAPATAGAGPAGGAQIYRNFSDCLRQIARSEGPAGLWKGFLPALLRQVCYTSMALVIYEPVRDFYAPHSTTAAFSTTRQLQAQLPREAAAAAALPAAPRGGAAHRAAQPPQEPPADTPMPPPQLSFGVRLLAGGTAGAIAITVFNPIEVVKTQMQAQQASHTSRPALSPAPFASHSPPLGPWRPPAPPMSMGGVVRRVVQRSGVRGLWAGLGPNVARTFLVNAAELGTYDEAKARLRRRVPDGVGLHVAASGCAGLASACVATPADVLKTRLMNAAGGAGGSGGLLGALGGLLRHEGPLALYKGFWPICLRKVGWCACFFVSYEQARALLSRDR